MYFTPALPTVSSTSTKPEDIKAWDDYYAECDRAVDSRKPGMSDRW
jgi:hypothetical protein